MISFRLKRHLFSIFILKLISIKIHGISFVLSFGLISSFWQSEILSFTPESFSNKITNKCLYVIYQFDAKFDEEFKNAIRFVQKHFYQNFS